MGGSAQQYKVTVTGSQDRPMELTEHLINYLMNRSPAGTFLPFQAGAWLERLDDDRLALMGRALEAIGHDQPHPYRDDVVSIVVHVVAAEKATPRIQATFEELHEWCGTLLVLTSFEKFRRMGMVELHAPLSLVNDGKLHFSLTERGLAMGEAINLPLH